MAEKAICKGHSCSFRHNKGQLNHQWACIFLPKLHCQRQPVSPLLVSSRKTSIYKLISRCTLPEESLQDGNKTQPEPDLKYLFLNCQIHLPFATHIHPLEGKGRGQYILMIYCAYLSNVGKLSLWTTIHHG